MSVTDQVHATSGRRSALPVLWTPTFAGRRSSVIPTLEWLTQFGESGWRADAAPPAHTRYFLCFASQSSNSLISFCWEEMIFFAMSRIFGSLPFFSSSWAIWTACW